MTDLDGKVALVTGAASGIGEAITTGLRDAGATVVTADLRNADVEADLTTREGNKQAVDAAVQGHGRLDIVVPNAGFQHVSPVEEFPEDRWDALIAILLTSPFLLARYAWPALREAGDGRFVAVASAHGLVASPYKAAYVAAKHGVMGLIKTLALEGAQHGITTAAICPGFVRTPLVEAQIADQAKAHGVEEDTVLEDVILAPHVVKKLIEPSEVADAVLFCLTPAGRTITGAPLIMDQGWTAR